MGELMDTAIKDGISMPGQTQTETPPAAKETAPATVKVEPTEQTPQESVSPAPKEAQVAPQPDKVPFKENPGLVNLRNQRDSFKSELQKAQELNQRLLAALEGNKPKSETNLSEQEQAAKQLRQILGIDGLTEKLNSLDKRNSEYSKSQRDASFDKEQAGIETQCQKFGMKMEEVVPELQGWLDSHPYFSTVEIQPGFYDIAFKALYFDKSTDLAKKSAYAEQLKETEKLKKANSEAPSPGSSAGTGQVYMGVKDIVKRRIESEGGISFPGH